MNAGTTLARSRWFAAVLGLGTFAAFVLLVELFIRVGLINRFIVPMPSEIVQALPRVIAEENVLSRFLLTGAEADRKSTRLNSSHVEISYAVFCLKKKRETI